MSIENLDVKPGGGTPQDVGSSVLPEGAVMATEEEVGALHPINYFNKVLFGDPGESNIIFSDAQAKEDYAK